MIFLKLQSLESRHNLKIQQNKQKTTYKKKFAALSEPERLKDAIQMHTKLQKRISIKPTPPFIYLNLIILTGS